MEPAKLERENGRTWYMRFDLKAPLHHPTSMFIRSKNPCNLSTNQPATFLPPIPCAEASQHPVSQCADLPLRRNRPVGIEKLEFHVCGAGPAKLHSSIRLECQQRHGENQDSDRTRSAFNHCSESAQPDPRFRGVPSILRRSVIVRSNQVVHEPSKH